MDKMIKITNFMHKISFAAVNNTTKPKRRIVMKKVLALVLSLVLMLGGSAAALAETAQSIPPLSQISSNPNSATFTWRSDVSTQDVEKKEMCYTEISITKKSSTSVSIYQITETNAKAAAIQGFMFVQRWNNNKWEKYATREFNKGNTTLCESAYTVTVESGYYYRLAVSHFAVFVDSDNSSCNTYSRAIYVN